jgi:hypothetical protein
MNRQRLRILKLINSVIKLSAVVLIVSQSALANQTALQRVNDLAYGQILFEYHQSHAFDALTLLQVAAERGGIQGHQEHPALIEGGLMLSYGMVNEAKLLFEKVLKEQLSSRDKHLAWFYLGKVFYLQSQFPQAWDSFVKIDQETFRADDAERYFELLYMKGQMAEAMNAPEAMQWMNALPPNHVFRFYLEYNQAVRLGQAQNLAEAIKAFSELSQLIQQQLTLRVTVNALGSSLQKAETNTKHSEADDQRHELYALLDQTHLSLARLQLKNNSPADAQMTLKQVRKQGPFAADALFVYALAASQNNQYELALAALTQLQEASESNPWRQQMPYALAYLYEQMHEPELAQTAYLAAVSRYETLAAGLETARTTLSESRLLEALNLAQSIGQDTLLQDAYGRLKLAAHDFNFATLLASEPFQLALSELHELYLLQNSLNDWRRQLDSFDVMLDTRQQARREKLQALQVELDAREVTRWQQQTDDLKAQIERAVRDEDPYFFMTDEQIAYYKRILTTHERLQKLPDDHPDKARYQTRLTRIRDYFDWWMAEQFTVNRWRTLKSMRLLEREMSQFQTRYAALRSEQARDEAHQAFVSRLAVGRERLTFLQNAINNSLATSRQHILTLVDTAMTEQLQEIQAYLLASRESLARVSDTLLNRPSASTEGASP